MSDNLLENNDGAQPSMDSISTSAPVSDLTSENVGNVKKEAEAANNVADAEKENTTTAPRKVVANSGSILGTTTVKTNNKKSNTTQYVAKEKKSHSTALIICLVIFGPIVALFLFTLLFAFMFGMAGSGGSGVIPKTQDFTQEVLEGSSYNKNKILILNLTGEITSSPVEYSSGINDAAVSEMLRTAQNDASIKGVIIEVNSPGGGVTASDKIHHAIQSLVATKPVYLLEGDMCASGCVYMSTHVSKIYAHPTTTTGSIGVIMHSMNLQKLLEKVGVEEVSIKSGKMKDIGSISRPMTKDELDVLQNIIDVSYNRFINLIADGRHLDLEKVREFSDGRIFTAGQAKELGLIDEIGYMADVKEDLANKLGLKDYSLITYKKTFSFFDLKNSMMKTPVSPLGQFGLDTGSSPRLMYLWQMPNLD